MARKKLIIEIDMTDEDQGIGVRVVKAMTGMIEEVFKDNGPLYKQKGEAYTTDYGCEDDEGDELMTVTWEWHNDKV